MRKPTIEDLKKELEAANKRILILQRNLEQMDLTRRIIIAAGLIDENKFSEAEELASTDS